MPWNLEKLQLDFNNLHSGSSGAVVWKHSPSRNGPPVSYMGPFFLRISLFAWGGDGVVVGSTASLKQVSETIKKKITTTIFIGATNRVEVEIWVHGRRTMLLKEKQRPLQLATVVRSRIAIARPNLRTSKSTHFSPCMIV